MLESCTELSECEHVISQHSHDIQLIGQIPLTDDDREIINKLIQNQLSGKLHENLDEVMNEAPSVLACYLVWKGIENYTEGDYWSAVSNDLEGLNTGIQAKLGTFFRSYLKRKEMILVDIPDARKNITPILMHGIIPRSKIPEFFEEIVIPLINHELVNLSDKYEIEYWLDQQRKMYFQEQELEQKKRELEEIESEINLEQEYYSHATFEERDKILKDTISHYLRDLKEIEDHSQDTTEFEDLERVRSLFKQIEEARATQKTLIDQYNHLTLHPPCSLHKLSPYFAPENDDIQNAYYCSLLLAIKNTIEDEKDVHATTIQGIETILSVIMADRDLSPDLMQEVESLSQSCEKYHEKRSTEIRNVSMTFGAQIHANPETGSYIANERAENPDRSSLAYYMSQERISEKWHSEITEGTGLHRDTVASAITQILTKKRSREEIQEQQATTEEPTSTIAAEPDPLKFTAITPEDQDQEAPAHSEDRDPEVSNQKEVQNKTSEAPKKGIIYFLESVISILKSVIRQV